MFDLNKKEEEEKKARFKRALFFANYSSAPFYEQLIVSIMLVVEISIASLRLLE